MRLLACLAILPAIAFAGPVRVLQPFDYQGVALTGGPLRRLFDEARDEYLRIPNDDLLKGFRQRAGRPAPGVDLGGWYTSDTFHIFNQILSGLARMYAATHDPACKAKADALLAEWGKCIAPDGYFYFSTRPNAPHYTYDKMVGGLVDVAMYAHSPSALQYLSRITDWAEKHLSRNRIYAFNAGSGNTEWYTLSENLYRAYLLTGDVRYRRFAQVWEYTDYWNIFALGGDIFSRKGVSYHAYSHVNTFGGAGAAYLVNGNAHYLRTLVHAYDFLQDTQCYATGGFGPHETLVPRDEMARTLRGTHNSFETQCGSWAAFKMSKYLITCTGDARYGDWVERLAINGIGAGIPMTPNGRVFYYSDYNTAGATKFNSDTGWQCCAGTRPVAVADLHDLIYFHDANDLFVNLYTPATVHWNGVTVEQTTRFPESDCVELKIATPKPRAFAIALRVPGWLAGPMRVSIGGKRIQAYLNRKHWLVVRRTWRDGERLHVTLPMGFWVHRASGVVGGPAALVYGPVVLAVRYSGVYPAAVVNPAKLTPVAGEALTYRFTGRPDVLVRPFYAFKEGEPYLLYVDPAMADRIAPQAIRYSGRWNEGGDMRYTNEVGATAEADFLGDSIRWLGRKFDDGALAEVKIDGKVVAIVDQYGPGRDLAFNWSTSGLGPGKHTIRLTVLSDKNPASSNRYLNVAGFELGKTKP